MTPGQDIALRSVGQGLIDFVWGADGDVEFDDTQEYRITTLLLSRLGEWWADSTGLRGSRLHTVRYDKKPTADQLRVYAEEALKKAVDEGFISDVKVWCNRELAGRYLLRVQWKTRAGTTITRAFGLTT